MPSVFKWLLDFAPAGVLPAAILATLVGIGLPLVFILARRAYRRRYFRRRDARTLRIRREWPQIVDGRIPPERWRFDRLDRDIVESILLDELEVAPPAEAERLRTCLRTSGLLDIRIWEVRHHRGWQRRQALVSLGRMRAREAMEALIEALDDRDADTRLAALRGLGLTGLPEGGEQILARLTQGVLRVAERPLQIALLSCLRGHPLLLVPHLHRADDRVRPLLARVLAELATADLEEEILTLASDPLPEVRASAARALGQAKPRLALTALGNLAADEAWFVRLRAVVAMGEMRDPRTIPALIGTLCDPNRHVRIRSAAALARLEEHLRSILEQVMKTRDRYALQAFVSELERSGRMLQLVKDLRDPARHASAEAGLLGAIDAGAHRLLLDTLVHHADWHARLGTARVLALSGDARLVQPLERLEAGTHSWRQRRVLHWVLGKLKERRAPAAQPDRVTA